MKLLYPFEGEPPPPRALLESQINPLAIGLEG